MAALGLGAQILNFEWWCCWAGAMVHQNSWFRKSRTIWFSSLQATEHVWREIQIRWGWRHHGEDQQLANHQVKQVGCVGMWGWFMLVPLFDDWMPSETWIELVGLQSGSESRNGMVKWVATHCLIRTISKVSVSDYFASRYPISLSIVNYLIFVYMLFWLSIIPTVFDYLSLNAFDGLTHLYYQLLAWILIWQLLFLLGPVGRCRRSRFEPPWGSKGLQFDRHWNNVCVFATNGKRWVLVGNQLIFIDFWTLDIFKDSLLKSFYWWLAFQLIVGLGKPAQLNAFPHCFLAEDSSQFSRIHLEVQPLPSPLRTPSIA